MEFFFEGAQDASAMSRSDLRSLADMSDFVSSADGLRLIAAFMRIENADLRRRIVGVVEGIAADPELGALR